MLVDDLVAEMPFKLRKDTFQIKMCEDWEEAEDLLGHFREELRRTGLLFVQFFTEKYFSHPAAIGLSTVEGQSGFT